MPVSGGVFTIGAVAILCAGAIAIFAPSKSSHFRKTFDAELVKVTPLPKKVIFFGAI